MRASNLSPTGGRISRGPGAQWWAVLLLVPILLMSACDSTTVRPTATVKRTVVVTSTPGGGLPSFSDWRVVYADKTGHVHAISTDGHNDVTGPMLVGLAQRSLGRPTVSSTGRYLAYTSVQGVSIIDLTGKQAPVAYRGLNPVVVPRVFAWSPDGSELAVDGGAMEKGVIHMPDLAIRPIPLLSNNNLDLIGWLDSSHIVGYLGLPYAPTPGPTPTAYGDGPPSARQTVTLGSEDLRTGSGKTIFGLTSTTLGDGEFSLPPDGKNALLHNALSGNPSFRPDYRLINLATGKVSSLTHIMQLIGAKSGFTSIAWRPGTTTLAVSTGFAVNGDLRTWLLDLEHDTAVSLPYQAYIAGWVPDNGPLILTTGESSYGFNGPFTLSAVSDPGTPAAKDIKLIDSAYHFTFGGFARTA